MTTVTIQAAKTQLSKLIKRGEEVIIARGKTPVARLIAYQAEQPKRGSGSMKGRATIGPEFWEPLPEEELKLWEGGQRLELLLDTHAFLWWLDGDPRLSARARTAISADPTKVQVSAATAWQIAAKARIGKLPQALDVAADIAGCVAREGFRPLAVAIEHGQRAGVLPGPLRDPFDRMLIAQAVLEDLYLVSIEHAFDAYGVLRRW